VNNRRDGTKREKNGPDPREGGLSLLIRSCKVAGRSREFEERKTVRGHIKLFTLQMNLEKCARLKITGPTEDLGYGLCRDAPSSIERIFLPIPELMSGR
jgi:hypothetical protein